MNVKRDHSNEEKFKYRNPGINRASYIFIEKDRLKYAENRINAEIGMLGRHLDYEEILAWFGIELTGFWSEDAETTFIPEREHPDSEIGIFNDEFNIPDEVLTDD